MHRKSFVICGLTFIAGIFGAFARWIQNTTAFEEETGLAVSGSAWSVIMAVCLLAGAVAIFFAVRYLGGRRKLTTGTKYPDAFLGGPVICTVTAFAALALMAVGGILTVIGALDGQFSVFDITSKSFPLFEFINGVFAIVAAVFIFDILRNINSPQKRSGGPAFIVVVLFLCLRLIAEYKTSASDPVIWHFAVRILAVSAVILAYYYLTGYCFEKPKPNRTLYFSMLGVFLSIITFADSVSTAYHLVTAGVTLALATLMLLLIGNMVPAAEAGGQPEDEGE